MKIKTFDCIEMKNRVQRQMQAEYEGLSFKERQRRMSERILSDPILGSAYKDKIKDLQQEDMMVAEDSPEYRVGNSRGK